MLTGLLGAVLVIGAGTSAGAVIVSRKEKALHELCGITRLTAYLATEIAHTRRPLDELIDLFSDQRLEKSGFLPKLRESRSVSYECRWNEAMKLLSVENDTAELCAAVGDGLGASALDDEITRLGILAAKLKECVERERDSLLRERKVIYSVSSMAGLAAAVILI